jgi:hypothetical protein
MQKRPKDDAYSEEEAQRRFLDALKAGLKTPPKPLKEKPKRRSEKKPGKGERLG